MVQLILIRHAQPEIQPDKPAREWTLSSQGREQAVLLAQTLKTKNIMPKVIITSDEPKAIQTGMMLEKTWGKPRLALPNLHEHPRPFVEDFEAKVAQFFANPRELVFGTETANQAHARFTDAVKAALNQYPDQSLAIVTHGTVMTLFICRLMGLDPFPFWQSLKLPDYKILSLPEMRLIDA